jgi:type II secretory pathway component PulK
VKTGQRRPPTDDGFVLIVVIWLIALLALFAVGFSASVRSHLRWTANSVQTAKAETIADAGVQLAVLSLVASSQSRGKPRRFPIDGQPTTTFKTPADALTSTSQVIDFS